MYNVIALREPDSSCVTSSDALTYAGVEYWEYRRAAFLAGKPFPAPATPATELPKSYTVPPPPPPAPSVLYCPPRGSSIERLEALLSTFGAEESDIAWNGGVGGVAKKLGGGKQLAKGLRLGLVVSTRQATARRLPSVLDGRSSSGGRRPRAHLSAGERRSLG